MQQCFSLDGLVRSSGVSYYYYDFGTCVVWPLELLTRDGLATQAANLYRLQYDRLASWALPVIPGFGRRLWAVPPV